MLSILSSIRHSNITTNQTRWRAITVGSDVRTRSCICRWPTCRHHDVFRQLLLMPHIELDSSTAKQIPIHTRKIQWFEHPITTSCDKEKIDTADWSMTSIQQWPYINFIPIRNTYDILLGKGIAVNVDIIVLKFSFVLFPVNSVVYRDISFNYLALQYVLCGPLCSFVALWLSFAV